MQALCPASDPGGIRDIFEVGIGHCLFYTTCELLFKLYCCPPLTVKIDSPWLIPFQNKHTVAIDGPAAAFAGFGAADVAPVSWVAFASWAPSSAAVAPPSSVAAASVVSAWAALPFVASSFVAPSC